MDYWEKLKLYIYEDFDDFFERNKNARFFFFTKTGKKSLFEIQFQSNDFLIFGRETKGLPEEITEKYKDFTVFLPMSEDIRSFNLSNTAAVAAFEAYRQIEM